MVRLYHRLFFCALSGLLASQAFSASTSWRPAQTVELIAAASAGSVHDRLARTTMRILQDSGLIPSAVVVVNKQGGGGTVALAYLANIQGNAHSISTATGTLLSNNITGLTKYNYTDFTVLPLLFSDYNIFSVRAESSIRSGADLLAKLKADPKSVSFAFAVAPGNYNHVAIAHIAKAAQAGIKDVKAVVYDGGGKAATAVLGGHVDVLVGGPGNVVGHIQVGRLRALAVSAPRRYEASVLANVPTWKEQGVDVVADNPYYFLGPKGMQQAQIDFWEQAFSKVVKTPEWAAAAEKSFWVTLNLSRAESVKYLDAQYREYKDALTELGLAKNGK